MNQSTFRESVEKIFQNLYIFDHSPEGVIKIEKSLKEAVEAINLAHEEEVKKARVEEIQNFVLKDFDSQMGLLKDENPFYKQLKAQNKYLKNRLNELSNE